MIDKNSDIVELIIQKYCPEKSNEEIMLITEEIYDKLLEKFKSSLKERKE